MRYCDSNKRSFTDCVFEKGGPIVSPDILVTTESGVPTDQLIHPSIVYAPAKGYKYWMAVTPYTTLNNVHENPSILVSNDLFTWFEPIGITNPIEGKPDGIDFNADTDLFFDGNYFHLIYTQTKGNRSNWTIRYTRSIDGINWHPPKEIISGLMNAGGGEYTSPSIMNINGEWVMYAVDASQSPNIINIYKTKTFPYNWIHFGVANFQLPSGEEVWHLEVKYEKGVYRAVVTTQLTSSVVSRTNKIYIQGSIDGISFLGSNYIEGSSGDWDEHPYRGSIAYNGDQMYLVYSAYSLSNFRPYLSVVPVEC